MIRNIEKAVSDGERLLSQNERYQLYTGHLNALREMSGGSEVMLICNSFALGFLQGMKVAKKIQERGV